MRSVLSTLAFSLPIAAAVYEVGPGKSLSSLGQVPWTTLQPGDTVKIYWRSTPYQEKFVIARSGTAAAPIVIQGIPDSSGALPIIEGNGAVTVPGVNFWNENRGLIKVGGANIPSDSNPGYIRIESLQVQGARSPNPFRTFAGNASSYQDNAAGIYVEGGHDVTVYRCIVRDNGNGIFVASNYGSTQNILLDSNYIYGNGNVGSGYEHNTYTEALGMTYQFNRFGPLKAGAGGNNLKDRSAGLVVRYNWIEEGNRQLDLVETGVASWRGDPRYSQTFVYGNILIENDVSDNSQIVHYGGDSGDTTTYRHGTLFFYDNTVISNRSSNTTLMRLSSMQESADVRNNIVFPTKAGYALYILDDTGVADLRNNWLRQGWQAKGSGAGGAGVVNNLGGNLAGTDPALASLAAQDYRPLSTSPVAGAATAAHAYTAGNPVQFEYAKHQASASRTSLADIGALAAPTVQPPPPPPPTIAVSPVSLTFGATAGGTNPASQTVNVSNTGGGTLTWTPSTGQPWITITPAATSFQVALSIAGLSAATYNGSITVSAAGATNTPVTIPVTLNLAAAPPPPVATTVFKEDFETLSEYDYTPPAHNRVLYPEGLYTIGTNPNGVHNLFCSFGDHTTGSGRMMIVNGRSVANSVWSRKFASLVPGRQYQLRAFAASVYSVGAAQIQAFVGGQGLTPAATLDLNIVPAGTLCPQAITAKWSQILVTFNAPANAATTPVTIDIRDLSTVAQGNDFVLDDIELIDATSASTVFKEDFETLSEYDYTPPVHNRVLYPEGLYTIGVNPNGVHNLFCGFGDHTTGSGRMMIANGRSVANSVWSRKFSGLLPNRQYKVRVFAASVYQVGAADLLFRINGAAGTSQTLDVNIVPVGTSCPQAITPKWKEISTLFTAPSTAATVPVIIDIIDRSTVAQGNDFVLDDIELILQ
ncbi:MAG: hypothetical protein U0Q16_09665 [Bryobacteraceae bacterium]